MTEPSRMRLCLHPHEQPLICTQHKRSLIAQDIRGPERKGKCVIQALNFSDLPKQIMYNPVTKKSQHYKNITRAHINA